MSRRCLEDLDPVVAAFQREVETGKLQRDHIFYKAVKNALEFATKIGTPTEQFQHDSTIQLFSESLEFSGKAKTMNLLRGPGFSGQKSGGKFTFDWKNWNFPFIPGKTTRAKCKGGYTTRNGIQKSLLESFPLIASSEESTVCPIISQSSLKLIPVSYATDGMSLKPGLQFDSRLKELVGLLFPVNLAYVQAHPKPDPQMLKKSFVTEADAVVLTTLDGKLSLPVGNSLKGKSLTGQSVFEKVTKEVKQIQICLLCFQRYSRQTQNVISSAEDICCSTYRGKYP